MRTTLFVTSLFAVTLATGAAFAEKPSATPVKAPRAIEKLRSHGETVDKVYRGSDKAAPQGQAASTPARANPAANPRDKVQSRILCSETGEDCAKPAARGDEKAAGASSSRASAERGVRIPAFMDKVLGSDRMVCNEAEECTMSTKAANRAWSRAGSNGAEAAGASGAAGAAQRDGQVDKFRTQRSEPTARSSAGDDGEAYFSSKAAKKIWSYEAVKAGTFNGPTAKGVTPAEKAIADSKKKN